jgi:hypothetical protein
MCLSPKILSLYGGPILQPEVSKSLLKPIILITTSIIVIALIIHNIETKKRENL